MPGPAWRRGCTPRGSRWPTPAFLASLALVSVGRGRPAPRREPLGRLLTLTERVVGAGFGGARDLAALRRLAIADAVRQGKERVLLVVAEVDRCFSGKLPLAYAEGVLAGGRDDGWRRADLARLRVLLCDSAFEAGFELRDLIEAGETAPALGEILGIGDTEALAHLRLLWSQRASRPWDRHGRPRPFSSWPGMPRRTTCWAGIPTCYCGTRCRPALPRMGATAPLASSCAAAAWCCAGLC